MENVLLDVAWVAAITAFVKQQFGTSGKGTLLVAVLAGMFAAFEPLVAASFPVAAPWLDAFIKGLGLAIGAAGSVDLLKQVGGGIAEKYAAFKK